MCDPNKNEHKWVASYGDMSCPVIIENPSCGVKGVDYGCREDDRFIGGITCISVEYNWRNSDTRVNLVRINPNDVDSNVKANGEIDIWIKLTRNDIFYLVEGDKMPNGMVVSREQAAEILAHEEGHQDAVWRIIPEEGKKVTIQVVDMVLPSDETARNAQWEEWINNKGNELKAKYKRLLQDADERYHERWGHRGSPKKGVLR